MMNEILENIQLNTAMILTAPPGWGKTYKLLKAIKCTKQKVIFLFPLRALCDEVYLVALKKKMNVINIRAFSDYEHLKIKSPNLILCTPELYFEKFFDSSYIYIFDEFHLFTYWGESFREKMLEVYFEITAHSPATIFLTATLSSAIKEKLVNDLTYNYEDIYHLNFGNQILKNNPSHYYFYPKCLYKFLEDDIKYSRKNGVSLIFCQYRFQVNHWCNELDKLGYRTIGCIGGEAALFIEKLSDGREVDFIVATSVVSHGVNLPGLEKLYFLYCVDNLDFYLQMLGRGGRDGKDFEVHIQNYNYFSKMILLRALFSVMIKRLSNRINYLLYFVYES